MSQAIRFVPCGDRSLLLYLGDRIDPAVNERVHALTAALLSHPHPALVEVTPAFHSLLVEFDPLRLRPESLEELVRNVAATLETSAVDSPRTVEIPVSYGGECGPDLDDVAAVTGLTPSEVVARHVAGEYRVYCLGFSPGFPHLGGLDASLHMARQGDPRTLVPGGSVGIGGGQTGVYPTASPGGWHIIGRTPLRLFDADRKPPTLLEPGDLVRFLPVPTDGMPPMEEVEPVGEEAQSVAGRTGLRVLQPGLATSLQDLGRRGYMRYGVPVAGAADFRSLMIGNWLLSNRARTCALEITLAGPEIEFTAPIAFCITGAPIPAEMTPAGGGSPYQVTAWTAHLAGPGDRLRLGGITSGCRSYLCIAGGFDLPPVLGSLSEDLFGKIGPLGRPLRTGDWLPIGLPSHAPANLAGRSLPSDLIPEFPSTATIHVTSGPQSDAFHAETIAAFFEASYRIKAQSDRQGLRLEGRTLEHRGSPDILSEPVPPGSIQVPASGLPILLLGNRHTIGGYTKIGVAVYPDLAQAAQLRPGDEIRFREVDQSEAHAIAWAERRKLAHIRRYLEREISRVPETLPERPTARIRLSSPVPPVVTGPKTGEIGTAASAGSEKVRRFRITIGGIEFAAEVEEITEEG